MSGLQDKKNFCTYFNENALDASTCSCVNPKKIGWRKKKREKASGEENEKCGCRRMWHAVFGQLLASSFPVIMVQLLEAMQQAQHCSSTLTEQDDDGLIYAQTGARKNKWTDEWLPWVMQLELVAYRQWK